MTGVTIMQMDAGLDTGPIIVARPLPIARARPPARLHDRLAGAGARASSRPSTAWRDGDLGRTPSRARRNVRGEDRPGERRIDWRQPAPRSTGKSARFRSGAGRRSRRGGVPRSRSAAARAARRSRPTRPPAPSSRRRSRHRRCVRRSHPASPHRGAAGGWPADACQRICRGSGDRAGRSPRFGTRVTREASMHHEQTQAARAVTRVFEGATSARRSPRWMTALRCAAARWFRSSPTGRSVTGVPLNALAASCRESRSPIRCCIRWSSSRSTSSTTRERRHLPSSTARCSLRARSAPGRKRWVNALLRRYLRERARCRRRCATTRSRAGRTRNGGSRA